MEAPDTAALEAIYASIPGGPEMLAWFDGTPSFHDAEIVSLVLNRRSQSYISIHFWNVDRGSDSYFHSTKHAVVTFELADIYDLQLDGFSHQNVISELIVSHDESDPERTPYHSLPAGKMDFEIKLEPCYGLDGYIRCKRVAIHLKPGKPEDARE